MSDPLGRPRLHLRVTDSTNVRARELALAGAPHGTLVTAAEQLTGRGRQGRTWSAPAGRGLLASLLIRSPDRLLSLRAGLAVAEACDEASGEATEIKWPNDVLRDGRKVAGILVEGRPQDGWAIVGIGLNVAIGAEDLPPELGDVAGGLGLGPEAVEPMLVTVLAALGRYLEAADAEIRAGFAARDALAGAIVRWADGAGRAAGIDAGGGLRVTREDGSEVVLSAGEVHLARSDG